VPVVAFDFDAITFETTEQVAEAIVGANWSFKFVSITEQERARAT
jgi:hypothetical protein